MKSLIRQPAKKSGMPELKLFTVGPVACYPQVLEAMATQMFSHRSDEYRALHRETVELLRGFLETDGEVFLFPSSGTGFMEASVRNCVRKKVLCTVCGSFGRRYAEVAETNGREVEVLEVPLGQPITPDLLDERLSERPDVEAVAITHNETSVGLINPLRELAEVAKSHGKLVFVDAVSSMGGVEIRVDEWGLDVCFSSSQKCFGVPPGLAVAAVSEEALRKAEEVPNRGWYFDFLRFRRYQERFETPMTPSIPQILALNRILKLIEDWGGKHRYFDLYRRRSETIRSGVEAMGLNLFPRRGYESPTVSCVRSPEGVDGVRVYEEMRRRGFELAKGYGPLRHETFRIGNMGHVEFSDIDSMLENLREVISNLTETAG